MRLKDKVALITGASNGMGAAETQLFAEEGATVIAMDIDVESGERLSDKISKSGNPVEFHECDVTNESDWNRVTDYVMAKYGSIDVLVNNAGVAIGGEKAVDVSIDQWQHVMDVNLNSAFYMCRAGILHMRRQGGGRIVNISSNVINTLPGGSAAYGTSKSGLVALTKILSKEEAVNGIRINAISPGMIDAGMGRGALQRRDSDVQEQFLQSIPMGRAGTSDEVAAAVLFLCSDEASYITGQNFNVNGGDRTESYQ